MQKRVSCTRTCLQLGMCLLELGLLPKGISPTQSFQPRGVCNQLLLSLSLANWLWNLCTSECFLSIPALETPQVILCTWPGLLIIPISFRQDEERWGAGVETQKFVLGDIGGWGRVPSNETYAPSLSTIYDGA